MPPINFISKLIGLNAGAAADDSDDSDDIITLTRTSFEDPVSLDEFIQWGDSQGIFPDTNNDEHIRAFLVWKGGKLSESEARSNASRSGSAGRTQFASEQALDMAQVAAMQFESALGKAEFQESQRQNTIENAMNRMQLMQTTDELADARRENAMTAMQAALPFMTSPGIMANLENSNAALQQSFCEPIVPLDLPTTTLPINEIANPNLAGGPQQIDDALLPLLNQQPIPAPTI